MDRANRLFTIGALRPKLNADPWVFLVVKAGTPIYTEAVFGQYEKELKRHCGWDYEKGECRVYIGRHSDISFTKLGRWLRSKRPSEMIDRMISEHLNGDQDQTTDAYFAFQDKVQESFEHYET